MADKTVEQIQFHQETVLTDENSPLHLIREKEIEISGRVLRAKREADEIIADARKKAAETIGAAENEDFGKLEDRQKAIAAEAESEAAGVAKEADAEVSDLKKRIEGQRAKAVELVLDAVARV